MTGAAKRVSGALNFFGEVCFGEFHLEFGELRLGVNIDLWSGEGRGGSAGGDYR